MKIDIYTSTANGQKYLSIPVGSKIEAITLPADVDPDVLNLSPFKTRLEVDAEKPHNALDAKDIVQQINNNGFAIHSSTQTIQLKVQ